MDDFVYISQAARIAGIEPRLLNYYIGKGQAPEVTLIAGRKHMKRTEIEAWQKPAPKTRGWPKGKKRNG